MDSDDLEPMKRPQGPKDLDAMSIEALNDYIGDLEREIERARQAIAAKQDARAGAEQFFKS